MRFGSFLIATILVLAGVVLLMLNLGYGSWQMVTEVWKFWPILLVLLGLSLLWGGRIPYWLALVIVVALAGVVVFLFLKTPGLLANRYDTEVTIGRQQYPGLSTGSVNIAFGGGRLTLGTETNEWLAGQFGNQGVSSRVKVQNGRLEAVLQNPGKPWGFGPQSENRWNIGLSPDITWDLELNAGAVEGQLNLTHIPLKEVDLKLGAGDINLMMGDNGAKTRVEAEAGAAQLTVMVAGDTGVSVKYDGVISQTNLKELGFKVVNGRYVSPNYDEAPSKIDIDLDMAVGEFRLETASAVPVAA